jgi:ParB-like chromosome segregation protein Spo0J
MDVQKIAIEKLSLDPANARKHNQKNLDAIKASLRRFGQQKPIVISKDNVVIAGNGTLEAALALGWTTIDCIQSNLKGSEITAYGIADNQTGLLSEWDDDILGKHLQALREDDWDLGDLGFDVSQLEEFKSEELNGFDYESDMDIIEKGKKCPRCGFIIEVDDDFKKMGKKHK